MMLGHDASQGNVGEVLDGPRFTSVSLGRHELLRFASEEPAFFGVQLERVSTILLAQVFQLWSHRLATVDCVTSEIKALEKVHPETRTKGEQAFNKDTPLSGLYYTHFSSSHFIPKNLVAEYGLQNHGNKRLDGILGKLFHEHNGEYVDEGFASNLAHEMTVNAWVRRAEAHRVTGEWIIIGKHKSKRYYLCLASHSESNEKIRKRVQDACAMDFDFISAGQKAGS